MTEPVLVILDLDREMRVEVDMSDFATGGVLLMKCEDEKWRPVAYISKSLNEAKRNYEIHDKEMLAIIQCLGAWRHFVTNFIQLVSPQPVDRFSQTKLC